MKSNYQVYSMRIRYGVVLLISLFFTLPVASQQPRNQAYLDVAQLIETFGGSISVSKDSAGNNNYAIDLHRTDVSNEDLAVLASLENIQSLDLRLMRIGDKGVAQLAGLRNLVFLNLFRTDLGNEGLAYLEQMKQLETLLIGGTRVTDPGLSGLNNLPSLKTISLFDTQVSDAGLVHLSTMSNLEVLLLDRSLVTDAGRTMITQALPELSLEEPN